MSTFLWLVVLAMPIFAVSAISRNHRRRVMVRSATESIRADEDGVRRTLADGRLEEVTWPEVTSVDVFTARTGPHQQSGGAVVLYGDATRGCIVPFDQLATSGLLDQLWRLPGFELDPLLRVINDGAATSGAPTKRMTLGGTSQRPVELWVRTDHDRPPPPDAATGA